MKKNPTLWFTRSKGIVKGPFTASMIRNNLLLGRLDPEKDKVSSDQKSWHLIGTQAALQTDYNIKAAVQSKHNLDERNGFDRRHPVIEDQYSPQNREGDRRNIEPESDIKHRQFRTLLMQKFRQRKEHIFWPLTALFLVSVSLIVLAIYYAKPFPSSLSNCEQSATAGVNWSNCLKPKMNLRNSLLNSARLRNSQLVGSDLMNSNLANSDMAYSDLRFANLSYSQMTNVLLLGANLKNTDLSYADLSGSDLSYADLSYANLGGSKLDNVRFDHAIWIDGQICASGSIGQCNISEVQNP